MRAVRGEAKRLKLSATSEVEAFVSSESNGIHRPKCLLLHGNPGSLSDWQHLVPRLAGAADVVAIDLPGFGKSPRAGMGAEFLSLDRLADDAIAAADALGWREPIVLVGHSHGGGVAQTAAVRHPGRVAGLVLVATLGHPVHASYRLLSMPGAAAFARLAGRMFGVEPLRPISRSILRRIMADIFWPELVDAERLERELSLLAKCPSILLSMVHVTLGQPSLQLFGSAPAIRCPTLFIHGSDDALVPPSSAKAIHELIVAAGGRSHFQLIPGAGHLLTEYQAAEVAIGILAMLESD